MEELVFTQAALLAGPLEQRQEALLRLLCTGAVRQLSRQLREGLTPENCKADFIAAASLYALAGLNGAENQVQEFRAGDLMVKPGGDGASRALRRQAELMLMPYCKDGFVFQGV